MGQKMGWDEGARNNPRHLSTRISELCNAYAQDSAPRGTDLETGGHRGGHKAEAGAMAGLAHHTKRLHERDFAANQANTETGINTGLAGTTSGRRAGHRYPHTGAPSKSCWYERCHIWSVSDPLCRRAEWRLSVSPLSYS